MAQVRGDAIPAKPLAESIRIILLIFSSLSVLIELDTQVNINQ